MPREPENVLADFLIDLAQTGEPAAALAAADRELTGSGDGHPAVHFARAVALHYLNDHRGSVAAADCGVLAALRRGRDGWRGALLAMRANQLRHLGNEDPASFDELRVLRDLAEAEVAVSRDIDDVSERIAAHSNVAVAYAQLRLYELALPQYLASYAKAWDGSDLPPAAAVTQQLNIAMLHLTWSLELLGIGETAQAAQHAQQAGAHAHEGQSVAAGDHREIWVERARLLLSCSRAGGPDPLAAFDDAQRSLAALVGAGDELERAFSAPFLGLALLRAGRRTEGIRLIEAALAAIPPDHDPLLTAGVRHIHLLLLADTDAGARAGLAYGKTLAVALWRQRTRTLTAADAVRRYERLRVEHQLVSRDSDVDALTGTAARRAFDRRATHLEARRVDSGLPVCVIVVDLDGLKQVNDRHGHQVGDVVLRGIGRALAAQTRGEDIVGRFGGDEFVALLSTEATDGRGVAHRMMAAIRSATWSPDLPSRPTVSIGIAVTRPDRGVADTLAAADRAMYAAKRAGGDRALMEADPGVAVRTPSGALSASPPPSRRCD